jgi:hypothetical protein
MPVDDSSKLTKGYAFIEFASAAEAAAAQEQTDGYKLDKQHVFKARVLRHAEQHATHTPAAAAHCAARGAASSRARSLRHAEALNPRFFAADAHRALAPCSSR